MIDKDRIEQALMDAHISASKEDSTVRRLIIVVQWSRARISSPFYFVFSFFFGGAFLSCNGGLNECWTLIALDSVSLDNNHLSRYSLAEVDTSVIPNGHISLPVSCLLG